MTGPPGPAPGQSRFAAVSNSSERNSLSGKNYLPRHSARGDRVPAHIGEALPPSAKGNPEGSPSDPVTTDPKGEAGRRAAERPDGSTCNTPALITTRAAYEDRVPLDPWFVSGLTEGEGCFCVSFALRAKPRQGSKVRPSFSLSLKEEGPGAPTGSTSVLPMRMDSRVQGRSHLQVRGASG
jgi:hypothetical protein